MMTTIHEMGEKKEVDIPGFPDITQAGAASHVPIPLPGFENCHVALIGNPSPHHASRNHDRRHYEFTIRQFRAGVGSTMQYIVLCPAPGHLASLQHNIEASALWPSITPTMPALWPSTAPSTMPRMLCGLVRHWVCTHSLCMQRKRVALRDSTFSRCMSCCGIAHRHTHVCSRPGLSQATECLISTRFDTSSFKSMHTHEGVAYSSVMLVLLWPRKLFAFHEPPRHACTVDTFHRTNT
jgi:hypothetical protein